MLRVYYEIWKKPVPDVGKKRFGQGLRIMVKGCVFSEL